MTPPTDSGHLLQNIVYFGRLLRGVDIEVTPTQLVDLVDALKYIDLGQREDVKNSARAVLIGQSDQLPLFDQAFDLFWRARESKELAQMNLGRPIARPQKPEQKEAAPLNKAGEDTPERETDEPLIDEIYTYSATELLRQKDFADLDSDELAEVERLIEEMQWQLERRRTRRKTRLSRNLYLDLRRTFRNNLRYGGEPLKLCWQGRKLKRRPLVVISDISGSMERYSRILLKFIYAISNGLDNVEAFVFGTRLTRITQQLRHRDIDIALDEAVSLVQDWGGGTRIGESLKTFNYDWGRRVLGQGAILLIISDGWDRGDINLLKQEMQRLQLSCQRLIWLNPHLGSDNYEPLTRGIQAALPHIDNFLPVHNLVSLKQLGDLLESLGERRVKR